jgi:hypothetical protein
MIACKAIKDETVKLYKSKQKILELLNIGDADGR